jgi:hypothetical protein
MPRGSNIFKLVMFTATALACSAMLPSCIKHNTCNITMHYVNASTVPYFGVLKKGNWWVYLSSNHERDSIYISNTDSTYSGGPKSSSDPCDEFQDNEYDIHSSYYFVPIPPDAFQSAYWIANPNAQGSQTDFTMGAFSVSYNQTANSFTKFNSNLAYQIDSLTVSNVVYKNILFGQDSTAYDKKVYWAKNMGIVRWITNTADTFNLIKYNVK